MTIPSAILQLLPDIRNDIKWRSNVQTGPKSCYVKIKRLSGKEMGSHTRNTSGFQQEKENVLIKDSSVKRINGNEELEKEKNPDKNGVHPDSDGDSSKQRRLEALNLLKKSLLISKNSSPSTSNCDVNQNSSCVILKREIAKSSPEYTPDVDLLNIENIDFDPQIGTDLEFEEFPIKENFESEASCDDVSGTGNRSSSEINLPSIEQTVFNEVEREENLSKSILQTNTSGIRNSPSYVSQNVSSFDSSMSLQYEESNAVEIASNEFEFEELPDIDLPYQSNDTINMNLNEIISEERVLEHEASSIAEIKISLSQNSGERVAIEHCESNLEERKQSENDASDDDSTVGIKFSELTDSSYENSKDLNLKECGKFNFSHLHGNISEIPNNEIISFIRLRYGTKLEYNSSIKSEVTSVLEREYDVNQEIADLQVALEELYKKSLDKIRILEHQANSDSFPSKIEKFPLAHSNSSMKSSEQLKETNEEKKSSTLHQKLVNETIERVIVSRSVNVPSKQSSESNNPNIKRQPKQISNFKHNSQKSIRSFRKKTTNSITDVRVECEDPGNSKDFSRASITSSNDEMKDSISDMINDKHEYKKISGSSDNKRKYSSCSDDNCRKKRKKMKLSKFIKRSSDDRVNRYERRSSHSSDKQKSSDEHKRRIKKRISTDDSIQKGSNKSSIKRRSSDKYDERRQASSMERSSCSSYSRASSKLSVRDPKTKTSPCIVEKTKRKSKRKFQDDTISEKKKNNDRLPDLTMAAKSSIEDIFSKGSKNCLVSYESTEEDSCDGDTDVFEEDEEIVRASETKSNDCKKSPEISDEKVELTMQLSTPNKESRINSRGLYSISENNRPNIEKCVKHSTTSSQSSVLFKKDVSIKHKSKLKLSSKTPNQTSPVLKGKYSELTRLLSSNPSDEMPTVTSRTVSNTGDSLLCDASLKTVRSLKEKDDNSVELKTVIDDASYKKKFVKSGTYSSSPNTKALKDIDILNPFEYSRKAAENNTDCVSENISNFKLISESKQDQQFMDANNLVNQDSNKNIGNCTASDLYQLAQKNSKSSNINSNTESDETNQTVMKVTKILDSLNCTEKYKKNMKIISGNQPRKTLDRSYSSNNRELRKEIVSSKTPNSNYTSNNQEGRKYFEDASKQSVPLKLKEMGKTLDVIGSSAQQMASTSSPIPSTKEYSTCTGQSSTPKNTAKDHKMKSINEFPNTTWINNVHPRQNFTVSPAKNIKDKISNPNKIINVRPSNIFHPNRDSINSKSITNSGRSPMISPNEMVLSSNQAVHNMSIPRSVSTSNVDSKLVNGITSPNATNLSSIHPSVKAVRPLYPQSSKQVNSENTSVSEKASSGPVKEKNTSNKTDSIADLEKLATKLPLLPLPGTHLDNPLQYGYSGSLFHNNVNYRYPGMNQGYGYYPNWNQNYLQHKNQNWVNANNDLYRFGYPSLSQRNITPANQFPTVTPRPFQNFPQTNQPIRMIQPEKTLVGANLQNNLNHSYIQSAYGNQMISQHMNSNNTQNLHHNLRQSTTNNLSNLHSSSHLQNSSNLLNYGMKQPTQMVQSFNGLPSYPQKDMNQNNSHPNNLNHETTLTNNVIQHSNLNNSVSELSSLPKSRPLVSAPKNSGNRGTKQQNQVSEQGEGLYVYNPHANTTVRINYPSEQEKSSKEINNAVVRKQNVQTSKLNNSVEHAAPPLKQSRAIAVKRMPSLYQRKKDSSDSAGSKALKVSLEHKEDHSSDIRRVIENLIPNTEMNLCATVSTTSSSLVVPVTSSVSGGSPIRNSVIATASTSGKIITVDLETEENEPIQASLTEDKCTLCRADLQAHMYPCCPTAIYCEKECQVKHWPIHYGECTNGTVIRN